MAKRISGLALLPRTSRNNVHYEKEELKKFHGVTVPLKFNHTDRVIGETRFTYNEELEQVTYEADVTDPEFQQELDKKQYQVSIGAAVAQPRQLCDSTGETCLNAPILGEIAELSIVETPGIPESTINVIEGLNVELPLNTSINTISENKIMAEDQKSETPEKVEEKVKVTIETDDNVEDKTSKKESVKTEEECGCGNETPEVKTPEIPAAQPPVVKPEEVKAKIDAEISKQATEVFKEVRESWTPKSEVQEATNAPAFIDKDFTDEEARKIVNELEDKGKYTITINKEDFLKAQTFRTRNEHGQVTEAVATSGTIPTVVTDGEIVIQPGSNTYKPIRQYGKFKSVPTGSNTARFYRITVPTFGALTESSTTDFTAVTHTLTAVDVTCAVRGWRQVVEWSEFEDYPATLLNSIKETARLAALKDEHNLIVQDLAATDHDFGGTSTAPYHIGGDGLATTTTTEEDADPAFGPDALTHAKRLLETQGHSTAPGNLIAFISPEAFEALISATALSEYSQIGNSGITRTGLIERIYGIDIIVTNELLQQNNADRNLVCVKGKSWALASQRDMKIKIQERISGGYVDIVATHRIGVDIIDPTSYIIVSTVETT